MGFFENIGADHPVSRELAKIVRTLSSDHKIESDLDLHVTALNNLCSVDGWTIHSGDKINVPFIVESIKRNPIRVALFNELSVNAFYASFSYIVSAGYQHLSIQIFLSACDIVQILYNFASE